MKKSHNNFTDRMLAHLSVYKAEELKITKPGTFQHQGRELKKAHILPKDRASENPPGPFARSSLIYPALMEDARNTIIAPAEGMRGSLA